MSLDKGRYPHVWLQNLASTTASDPPIHEWEIASFPVGMDRGIRRLHTSVRMNNEVVGKVAQEEGVSTVDRVGAVDTPPPGLLARARAALIAPVLTPRGSALPPAGCVRAPTAASESPVPVAWTPSCPPSRLLVEAMAKRGVQRRSAPRPPLLLVRAHGDSRLFTIAKIGVHDARNGCSRSSEMTVHDRPKRAESTSTSFTIRLMI